MSHVSSWFVDQTLNSMKAPIRRMTIGTSDYSEYVDRWPTIKRAWDKVRPGNINIPVINNVNSPQFDFFKTDKVKMLNEVVLSIGYASTGADFQQTTSFLSDSPSPYDYFGLSLAINTAKDQVLISSQGDDTYGNNSGELHVFHKDPSTMMWSRVQKLHHPSLVGDVQFPNWIEISQDGTKTFLGSHRTYVGSARYGDVVIAQNSSNGYVTYISSVVPDDPSSGQWFGKHLDCSSDGSILAVGAHYDTNSATDAGAVYIFVGSSNNFYDQHQKIIPSDATSGGAFGEVLKMSGDGSTLIIASPGIANNSYNAAGKIYFCSRTFGASSVVNYNEITTWTIAIDSSYNFDYLGRGDVWQSRTIACNHDASKVAIGGPYTNSGDIGAVYILASSSNGTWNEEQVLMTDPSTISEYLFGYSIAMSNSADTLIVGHSTVDRPYIDTGEMYVYRWYVDSSMYVLDQISTNTQPQSYSYYGFMVDLSDDGQVAVVGVPNYDINSYDNGQVFLFENFDVSTEAYDYVYTDDFNRADEDPVAGDWTAIVGFGVDQFKVESNQLVTVGYTNNQLMGISPSIHTFSYNHYAQIEYVSFVTSTGADQITAGPAIRCSSGSSGNCYYYARGNLEQEGIYKLKSGSVSLVASWDSSSSSIIKLVGNEYTISAITNSGGTATVVDSEILTGQPGMYGRATFDGADHIVMDNFETSYPGIRTANYHPSEYYDVYRGFIEGINYKESKATIRVQDQFKVLGERTVGTKDTPAIFSGTNIMPSDIFWTICTCYGGLSSIQSTSNVDIDYTSFLSWAAVFSADNMDMEASYDGVKCLEALKDLSRMTHSTIASDGTKIYTARYSFSSAPVFDFVEGTYIVTADADLSNRDTVNRQYVYGAYNATSSTWGVQVVDVRTISVNSFGAYERIEKSENIWFVSSAVCTNLAQRKTINNNQPTLRDSISTTLVGLATRLGDVVTTDATEITTTSETLRVMDYDINMDTGAMRMGVDATQLYSGFTLDSSNLDGDDALT